MDRFEGKTELAELAKRGRPDRFPTAHNAEMVPGKKLVLTARASRRLRPR